MTKGKKIAIISVSAVVALIIITIIVLALVKTTFFNLNGNDAKSMRVYINGEEISVGVCSNPDKHAITDNEGQKIFKNVAEKNEGTSQESVLTCIMSGAFGFKASYEEIETTLATIKSEGVVLEFVFDEEKVLCIDNEEQKDKDNNLIKYSRIYLQVSNTTDLAATKAYLLVGDDKESNFVVTFLAKQSELYNYIMTLED